MGLEANPWAPFCDEEEWGLAEWLAKRVNQKATDEFLKLAITKNRTQPSYTSNYTFRKKLDKLPKGPGWMCDIVTSTGDRVDGSQEFLTERHELWRRDPVECVRELVGNPAFKEYLAYLPEKVYEDPEGKTRVYDEMWTGDWWWNMQEHLPPGAVIAPVILASDKTNLTRFRGDKAAWPIYLTIGNIKKDIRRQPSKHATVLIGYLPISKMLHFKDDEGRQLGRYRLFHNCMRLVMESLIDAGCCGVEMICTDGNIRHIFPILAAYIADHPEQCLIACCKENHCPCCVVGTKQRGDHVDSPLRNVTETRATLKRHQNGEDPHLFDDHGLCVIHYPFWAYLPHTDIFTCITPDILHQLHKGVFKDHIVSWCATIISNAEFDARFQAMSDFHGLRHFKWGISNVSQWTCTEHKEMQHVVLGVIAGAVEPRVFQAARAILDFIYYAQYHAHTDTTLMRMQEALNVFHANKAVFIEHGLREHFNIPKVHSMCHYVQSIRSLGSADGFNSESPEHLHIDYAKDAYQVSSKVDYIAQMTHWLKLQEAVFRHGVYLDWVASQSRDPLANSDLDALEEEDEEEELADSDTMMHTPDVLLSQFTPSGLLKSHGYRVAKTCPFVNVSMSRLQTDFGAIDFIPALQTFLARHFPHSSISASEYDRFNVFKSVLLLLPWRNHISDVKRLNRIRAHPAIPNSNRRKPPSPAHFDVAFIVEDRQLWESSTGFDGLRLAQIHAIFKLPSQYGEFPHPLAYIEWFRPLCEPEAATRLYRVAQSTRNQQRFAAVVSVQDLLQGGHLFPRFGSGKVDVSWINSDVLELADEFYVNPYINFYLFDTMERL
ncbi:uncharacterized protein F5891DRAFT_941482 [Suillus fuscotomentosus]|uniref:Uncharacterized protein n=1 Tax=Suillus fuscotomentosus TaxID=1912939 RepID=A0AAD4HS26_9AGAM|nr:uncharacterized protein F5891DRAFT_941482 [Suillus fuscotomentosus]KAG1906491.1 hypothetical protein F5891DRAFT_941482 [Suillus fuscotomentosus]